MKLNAHKKMDTSSYIDALSDTSSQDKFESNDHFNNFDIDIFAHLNNSDELPGKTNKFENSKCLQKKHNSSKEIHLKEPIQNQPQHIFLKIDLKQMLLIIQTHKGSLGFQIYLSTFPDNQMDFFIRKISPILLDIMCSHYGNYFFQKLLQKLNYTQREYIFNMIKNNIIEISTHKSGTYSIQALIGELQTKNEKENMLNVLAPFYYILFTNENAYHIILKLIIDYPEHKRISLNHFIINNICSLAQNQYSYTCITKFIACNKNMNVRMLLLQKLSENFVKLISFNNGCNIILFVVEKLGSEYINFIYNEMMSNFSYFIQNGKDYIYSIEKLLINMYKYNPKRFVNMIWQILENYTLINLFLSCSNGIKLISIIFQFAIPEQKQIFLLKNKHFLQNYVLVSNNSLSFEL